MFNDRVKPKGSVGKRAVVAHRHSESAEPSQADSCGNDTPARCCEEREADCREGMNRYDVVERGPVTSGRLPPRLCPWLESKIRHDRSITVSPDPSF